jgi:hypothetical protein
VPNLFSNRIAAGNWTFSGNVTVTSNLTAGNVTAVGGSTVSGNMHYNTSLLLPVSNLTNYTVSATNAEYIVNATNSLDFSSYDTETPTKTTFVGLTITNYSGSDQIMRVNTNTKLGSSVAKITNGYVVRVVVQFHPLGGASFKTISSAIHE